VSYLLLWAKVLATEHPVASALAILTLLTLYMRAACKGRKE
jgi:hypothetical protein